MSPEEERADVAYEAIRASITDVRAIAAATGYKPRNITKAKRHLFLDEHLLDRFLDQGVPAWRGRFDPDERIAAA